jgi:hypothetical protein
MKYLRGNAVNSQTAKLLRKAAENDPEKYKQVKTLYKTLPRNLRQEAKAKAGDLVELHRQQAVVNSRAES